MTVIPTPVDPQTRELNLDALRRLVRYLLRAGGCSALIPMGSLGEFPLFTQDERASVVEAVIDEVAGRVKVIAGASGASTDEALNHVKIASELGADGVMVVPPYYSLPSQKEILEFYRAVSEVSRVPVVVYNNPFKSGVDILPETVASISNLPGIAAIKETSGDVHRFHRIRACCGPGFDIICGDDTLAVPAFALGACGWITGASNLLPKQCQLLWEYGFKQRDMVKAMDLFYEILPFLEYLECGRYTQKVVAGLNLLGLDIGGLRRPLLYLEDDELEHLRTLLGKWFPV